MPSERYIVLSDRVLNSDQILFVQLQTTPSGRSATVAFAVGGLAPTGGIGAGAHADVYRAVYCGKDAEAIAAHFGYQWPPGGEPS